ncbi:MAG: isoleucine--tRNA ligase [Oscillospiraceae bacterium]|nr:isoleucine--tRNA ligase [Oscillospiraceae bacterium]
MPDYNGTLNLPKTDFAMRAGLPNREPAAFKLADQSRLYYRMVDRNKGKPSYILHDGPPYANGDIHLGHALNKTLKDIIVKHKNMSGYYSPYVPGWDTHGLPTEIRALKSTGVNKDSVTPAKLRSICRDYAMSYVEIQKEQLKGLGTLADYDNPYITLRPDFEARQIEVFGEMAKKGYIYKGLRPVYWCPECTTALAEAEIEYQDDPCFSIYVKFEVTDDKGRFASHTKGGRVYFVIWTTTTWTLPGNVAISLGSDFDYALISAKGEYYVMAKSLTANVMETAGISDYSIIAEFKGSELEYIETSHPFLDRRSLIITGDHVTLESGTGCVHTAPGHGTEDFEVCKKYPELEVVLPVDERGILTELAGEFCGLSTEKSNRAIGKKLEESGLMFAHKRIEHQYPHCWRCRSPIIYRATNQWFCSVKDFKQTALDAIGGVKWIPAWGEERIRSMVADRNDWCISRQRKWGVPIPIIYCKDCGKEIIDDTTIAAISKMFKEEGSDSWYLKEPKDFLPDGYKCSHCAGGEFSKETDIMDVWFDSGTSHFSVLENWEELSWPADLYLEGNDQHRGWFQSSLLTSIAVTGKAPYRAVCTHGMVVDGDGRKMSKSAGNGIAPDQILKQYGADILRLWVASSDYRTDIRISQEILKQLTEVYRKIRNTARFILGNLYDFDPDKDSVSFSDLQEIDRWALYRLDKLTAKCAKAYDDFEFHTVYHSLHNFCVVDMSNFYLDIIKDRLYCEKANSHDRRCAQTAMYDILSAIVRISAPILAFTSDEIWSCMPRAKGDNAESVYLNDMPCVKYGSPDERFAAKWERLYALRENAQKALEIKRAEKVIGSALEAKVVVYADGDEYELISGLQSLLATLFIVSQVEVRQGAGAIEILPAEGEKCDRCWTFTTDTAKSDGHICARCTQAIRI